ncbi:MAG: hypothetical protein JXA14_05080 [Anaerolineae bacterium]|nr:hypothetical protein [Anaerolineae bacterium]
MMKRNRFPKQTSRLLLVTVMFPLFVITVPITAQGPDDTLDWWTVDGGGGRWASADGAYMLNGTVGQPDAHVWANGKYALTGGFWSDSAASRYKIYLPCVLRDFFV